MPTEPQPDVPVEVHVYEQLLGRSCGWCRQHVSYSGRGRPASYCSKSCRNRAWEVRSAEARLQRDIATGAVRTGPVREVIRETVVQTRLVPEPAAQPRVETTTVVPATANAWRVHLDELTRQLREGELGRQHWHHEKLYRALIDVVAALGEAYPGGIEHLQRNASRRSR
ncbi:hypothetical protein [Streptosporangium lutulentum]|uniref:Uncharacterized protein n=1 Tax=Streptosporangium lutulentum TaxID=1461250 RepID=A0ABT9QN00_9ACTN|nr:hypothetical protein [Streptosporangium lutulentum]MDP9848138.1 hypothetical protein [Streptosporangium lutulentum]